MPFRIRRCMIALPSALLVLGNACHPTEEDSEHVGEAVQPIQGGTLDDAATPLFPEVVWLAISPGGLSCSGTLITPRTILTARHCFQAAGANAVVNVRFGLDPSIAPNDHRFPHTPGNSGPILALSSDFNVNAADDFDTAKDVAIFFLDKPVPRSIAVPHHPSLTPNVCPNPFSGFKGTLVGFGPAFDKDLDPGKTCGDAAFVRRYHAIGGWKRESFDPPGTSVYFTNWLIPLFPIYLPCVYTGSTGGDSGGPLFSDQLTSEGQTAICSVTGSGTEKPAPGVFLSVENDNGGVDSFATIQMFHTQVPSPIVPIGGLSAVDAHGNWLGECQRYHKACDNLAAQKGKCNEADSDNDGVIDLCDDCPSVFNPEQTAYDDDPDKNGWGAACDFCPGTKYSWGGYNVGIAGNCHYEAQLGETYPGQSSPPTFVGAPASFFDFALKKIQYVSAFRPDACDFVTCPRQSRIGGNLDELLPVVSCLSGNPQNIVGCNCIQDANQPFTCRWDVSPNTLQISAATNEAAKVFSAEGQNVGDMATIGMRWCKCKSNVDPTTLAGRAQCQGDCKYSGGAYDGSNPWFKIATEPSFGWPFASDVGAEFSLPVTSLASADSASAKLVRWDFTDLPTKLITTTKSAYGGLTSASANGILMAKVAAVGGSKVTPTEHPTFYKLAQTFQSGRAEAALTSSPFLALAIAPSWMFLIPTPGPGPDPYHLLGKSPSSNELWITTSTGIAPAGPSSPGLTTLFADVASGNRMFVPASEMPSTLARRTPVGDPVLRGVAIDPVHPQVTAVYESPTPDALPASKGRDPCVPPRCSPVFKGDEAVVLSGSLRTLIVFGGTSDGTEKGVPNASSWLLDVDENAWTELPLELGARPGHIRSATYRDDDMRAYFVESKNTLPRLARYLPRGELEELAILPKPWASYPIQYLAAGEAGDLVIAASETPTGTEEHVLVCHHPAREAKAKTIAVDADEVADLLNPQSPDGGDGDKDDEDDKDKKDKDQKKQKKSEKQAKPGSFMLGPCPGDVGDDPGAKASLLARFQVAADGKLSFLGAKHLVTPLLARPIVTHDAVLATVPQGKLARLRHVRFAELLPLRPMQAPQIE